MSSAAAINEPASEHRDEVVGTATRVRLLFTVSIAVLSVVYAFCAAQQTPIIDDGAITLRYAERLSQGRGFSYNDGEFVNGASNPLFTLLLAAVNLGVRNINLSVWIVSVIALVLTITVACRFLWDESPLAAAVFAILFTSDYFLVRLHFDGLESPLTCLLLTLVFIAIYRRKWTWVGVFLGLLVVNKLDGAIAAIAFAVLYVLKARRFPWKVALVALATAAPIAVVLLVYFGSVLPQSMLSKLVGPAHGIVTAFDRSWIARGIYFWNPVLVWVFGFGLFALAIRREFGDVLLVVVTVAYFAMYSLVNLGAQYPWYMVAPTHLMTLASAIFVAKFEQSMATRGTIQLRRTTAVSILAATSLACMAWNLHHLVWGTTLDPFERTDLSRAAAGAWLRKRALASECLLNAWGWSAFEFKGQTFDLTGLTSRPVPPPACAYALRQFTEAEQPPREYRGEDIVGVSAANKRYLLLATFRIPRATYFFAMYAHEDSTLARRIGEVDAQVVQDLPRMDLRSNDPQLLGNKVVQKQGNDLFAHAPFDMSFESQSARQLFLAFTPELEPRVTKDDGVSFEVAVDGATRFNATVRPEQRPARVRLPIEASSHPLTIRLRTLPQKSSDYDWAWFRELNLRSGDLASLLSPSDFTGLVERQARAVEELDLPDWYAIR